MTKTNLIWLFAGILFISSCATKAPKSDAYGNFEATEITVSAEANGRIFSLDVKEGQILKEGAVVGHIDSLQLVLKRMQLKAQRAAIASKTGNIVAQMDVLNEQKNVAATELKRVESLMKDKAATQKQFDDIKGQITVLEQQVKAIETQNTGVVSEIKGIDMQVDQVNDQVHKCTIINPADGTVLAKYAEPGEIAVFGKSLYKIANLNVLNLRVYISGSMLPNIKLGQKVEVLVDKDETTNKKLDGSVIWVSDNAEFTPKVIQTKEERVNMVYAVKIAVNNDGTLKIGMPGEVNFPK